jgi:multisubunit Na+/H+ antiporter MnhB subunit
MKSLILQGATRLLVLLMLAFSVFLLWRGHNEPGGGFVGGLVASVAAGLVAMSAGPAALRRALRVDPRTLAGAGLLVALGAGILGWILGSPFLGGHWISVGGLKLGTPLLFDVGVYLVVVGAVTTLLLTLEEDEA